MSACVGGASLERFTRRVSHVVSSRPANARSKRRASPLTFVGSSAV